MNKPIVEGYESMTPTRLREVYWEWRRQESLSSATLDARCMRIATERVEMIERIADKRKISLTKEARK